MGTEPFWDLYITDQDEVLYMEDDSEIYESYAMVTPLSITDVEQSIMFMDADGRIHRVYLKKEPSDDGMSEVVYPYYVSWEDAGLVGVGQPHK
jgi:uncharacterized membrane protein